MNAKIVEIAGIKKLKIYHMANTNMARIKNFLTPQWLKEFEEMKRQAASSKRQASSKKGLDRAWALGYSGIMELSNFLDKYHSRADKMRILKKMLKAADSNKRKAISLKKARSIIFNHKEGDMKI